MKRLTLLLAVALAPPLADAFCGFYVAQQSGDLFNRSSVVVLSRDGDHTVLTMANDYRGEPDEFGLVVPVPVEITPGTVSVVSPDLVTALRRSSDPRLVEYHDPPPCGAARVLTKEFLSKIPAGRGYQTEVQSTPRAPAVTVEQRFDVEEYEVTVISVTDGDGSRRQPGRAEVLQEWLVREGYRVPPAARPVLESYLRQGMHFFLARIDLTEQRRLGVAWPRPLQVRFDSPKFALPIRLGTVNADGAQDLIVLGLTRHGRIETTNYRMRRVPTDVELPRTVRPRFGEVYEALFDRLVHMDRMSAIYLEYAWPLQAVPCDPCTGAQVGPAVLAALGAPGVDDRTTFLTRLHVRYDAAHFPEDLVFQETRDREPWQARYVLNHPFPLDPDHCPEEREAYLTTIAEREARERANLWALTGEGG